MQFVESLSGDETKRFVEHFVTDTEVVIIPGPGKRMQTLARGFNTGDEANSFSLNLAETTFIPTSRFSQSWLGKKLGAKPRVSYNILIEDLTNPSQSRNTLSVNGYAKVVFLDETFGQSVRDPAPDDIAFVNNALNTVFSREILSEG